MLKPRLIVLQPTPYCNINCSYCYLGQRDDRLLMSPEVLHAVCDKILSHLSADSAPMIVWHAGEPTTVPTAWYRDAAQRARAVCPPGTSFLMQSNGIGIDARWAELLRETGTRIGLSIDGPQRFHDLRRRTRTGGPTWSLALRGLRALQGAGLNPSVITVLHPDALGCAEEFYNFYREHGIDDVSFSIDEREGAHARSMFETGDYKHAMTRFLVDLLDLAFRDRFALRIRETERIATLLAGGAPVENEQIEPWSVMVIAANGDVSTFSPELMEVRDATYNNFVFGNILTGSVDDLAASAACRRASMDIAAGVEACRSRCRYFSVCGGGAPVNKLCETGSLTTTETAYCRCTTQAAADALLEFMRAHASANADSVPERIAAEG
jgi:uncharacterized protein